MIVLFGRHRWRRRRAIARLGLAEIDDFGRPRFLYLTDTHRKRRQIARDFEGRDAFEPPAAVVADLLSELWTRWGDGRAVLSSRQVAFRALPLIQGSPLNELGDPHRTARQLGALLAATLEAGQRPPLEPAVDRIVSALQRRCDTSTHLLAQTATAALLPRFASPSQGLERWMSGLPTVIVDDILQPTPLRTAALLGLLEGIAARGPQVVFAFESGHALDTDDVAAFLGASEQSPRTHKAFAATHRLRTAVFERFVASGRAELVLAREHGPVPFDLQGPEDPPEDPDLADLLHAEQPIPVASLQRADPVILCCHPSLADEVWHVATGVRRVLDEGVSPRDCIVAVSDLDAYRYPLQAAFSQVGVEVDFAQGLSLARTPIGRVIRHFASILTQPSHPLDWLDLCDLLGHPVENLLQALAGTGVREGHPSTWAGAIRGWALRTDREPEPFERELEPLTTLEALVESMRGSVGAEQWRTRLATLPLGVLAARTESGLIALGSFQLALHDLLRDLDGPWSAEDLFAEILHLLYTTPLPSPPGSGVAVTGLLELRGLTPAHCWVVGLTRHRFPAPWPPSPLVGPRAQHRLAPVDRLAEARYLLGSLLRNALGDPSVLGVTLSWPAVVQGRPVGPSVVLAEWLQRETTDGKTVGDHLVRYPSPTEPGSREGSPIRGVGHLGAASDHRDRPRLSVTAAESALRCPAAYWYRYQLALDPVDPWDPELEPRRRGTALHGILQRFYEARDLNAPTDSDRDQAAVELHRIANQQLDEVEAAGGFEPALQSWARARWLAGLLDDAPAGLLASWLAMEIAEGRGPVAVESPIRLDLDGLVLVGTVDRLDRLASGVTLVTDYKTGQAPPRARVEAGLALQPLVYVEAAARENPGSIASSFQLLSRPDAIRRTGWFGDASAVKALGGSRALTATPTQRAERLSDVRDRLEEVLEGAVNTTSWGADLAGCSTCRFRRVCRVRHEEAPC